MLQGQWQLGPGGALANHTPVAPRTNQLDALAHLKPLLAHWLHNGLDAPIVQAQDKLLSSSSACTLLYRLAHHGTRQGPQRSADDGIPSASDARAKALRREQYQDPPSWAGSAIKRNSPCFCRKFEQLLVSHLNFLSSILHYTRLP